MANCGRLFSQSETTTSELSRYEGHEQMKKNSTAKALTAEELDTKFDSGEDITEHLDLSTVTRPGL